MKPCHVACRVLPDRAGRPRVAYLTGWLIGGPGATWTYDPNRADVLRGTEDDARRWIADLDRENIRADILTDINP